MTWIALGLFFVAVAMFAMFAFCDACGHRDDIHHSTRRQRRRWRAQGRAIVIGKKDR